MRCTHLLPTLAVAVPLLAGGGPAAAGDCVLAQGDSLVLRASDSCTHQLRRDPALRRQVAQVIGQGAGGDAVAWPGATEGRPLRTERSGRTNLTHPLARLSSLNAQSRYLWSLSNPAPTYYGQTQAR